MLLYDLQRKGFAIIIIVIIIIIIIIIAIIKSISR